MYPDDTRVHARTRTRGNNNNIEGEHWSRAIDTGVGSCVGGLVLKHGGSEGGFPAKRKILKKSEVLGNECNIKS